MWYTHTHCARQLICIRKKEHTLHSWCVHVTLLSQTCLCFPVQKKECLCVSSVVVTVSAGWKQRTADLIASAVRFLCRSARHWDLNATVCFIVKRDYGPTIATHTDAHHGGSFWSRPVLSESWHTANTVRGKTICGRIFIVDTPVDLTEV